ncbi:hypothetical protein HK097_009641 [Rhizophlyctis rosea]|uniref:HECT-type E3 ubiquitin transferase n=1 Tax=Rhizophlyctis rosea TaxID=64517 RepID=A0AAD5X0A2_9FUNG|nr:hypothetical protein HK097_009641 [Rhizophlyctis rosea]
MHVLNPIDPRLQKQLDVLLEPTHMRTFIAAISDSTELSVRSVPVVSNFLITLFSRWHAKRSTILESLLLSGVSLLTALWNAVRKTRLWEVATAGRVHISIVEGTTENDEISNGSILTLSRRRFCPLGHWLMSEYIDLNSFLEAAVAEDDVVAQPTKRALGKNQKILNNVPFVIPFDVRVKIFREWVRLDRNRNGLEDLQWHNPIARITIRRQHVFEDGFSHLNALGSRLKNRIAITFISEQGYEEAGIDGGGVFKEFLTSLSKQAFDPNYGLFQITREQLLYPSPHAVASEDTQLPYMEFLGRILGKALYEDVLVDAAFAPFFLTKWLGRINYLDDLPSLDPDLYRGLISLKNYDGDVADMGLTFSIDDDDFGTSRSVDLVPNGSHIPVTAENRRRYIHLVANYRLNTQIMRQTNAFFRGLKDLIEPKWLKMFNQQELQMLIGGATSPIDIADLRRNTQYGGGFDEEHPTVQAFWNVVEHFDEEDKRKLVKFVTSCARPPLLGFKELRPQFAVRNAGQEVERLPTASTCVNLLKMPAYRDPQALKEKLLYAINAGAGFELS